MNRETGQPNLNPYVEIPRHVHGADDEAIISDLESKLHINQELLAEAMANGNKDAIDQLEQDCNEIIEALKAAQMPHVASNEALVNDKVKELNKKQYLN